MVSLGSNRFIHDRGIYFCRNHAHCLGKALTLSWGVGDLELFKIGSFMSGKPIAFTYRHCPRILDLKFNSELYDQFDFMIMKISTYP